MQGCVPMTDNDMTIEARSENTNDNLNINVGEVPNPVLKRIIEEIRYQKTNRLGAYDRTHNRHNRGR